MATQNVPQSNPYLESTHGNSKEKLPKRVVRLQLEPELSDAIEVIRDEIAARMAFSRPRLSLPNTIEILLKCAAWAHSCGRDVYGELREGEPGGIGDWNTRICGNREVNELERLFNLGDTLGEDEIAAG
jgi:hypothetical protein